jgi:light-independent protochlorophyllide reductase subunit B
MGPEGANVIFDTWVHPLMMGLEEHLLQMFRGDFEFADGALPSHLAAIHPGETLPQAAHDTGAGRAVQDVSAASAATAGVAMQVGAASGVAVPTVAMPDDAMSAGAVPAGGTAGGAVRWAAEAERELGKIPFFVRGKARRNTERFAAERGIALVSVETLYDAKAHFGR